MLRQIHIFYDSNRIFTHNYAIGLGIKELENVIELIRSYMDMPMPGKTFQKPLSSYQVFHQGKGKSYFVIITDQVDSKQYIEKIMNKLISKFSELYDDPQNVSKDNQTKSKFLESLSTLQKELHSKISIAGPYNAGKTTLYNKLKVSGTERNIMDFAKSSRLVVDNLNFDIWDFQLQDNASLLWSKFISGSDLIILVFDISNYNLQVLENFLALKRREGKLSRLLVLANKVDLIDDSKLKKIQNELNIPEYYSISLDKDGAKFEVLKLIRETLDLKKSLPENFESLMKKSISLEKSDRLVEAVKIYKELIDLSKKNQLFSYIKNFEEKISKLNKEIQEKVEIKRKLERKKKFAAPEKINFNKKVKVKTLPGSPDSNKNDLTPIPSKDGKAKEKENLKISADQIKLNLQLIGKGNKNKSKKANISNEKSQSFEHLDDQSLILQKIIESKGSSLNKSLCEQYLSEMEISLGRSLEYSDIEIAAEIFIKQEKSI